MVQNEQSKPRLLCRPKEEDAIKPVGPGEVREALKVAWIARSSTGSWK